MEYSLYTLNQRIKKTNVTSTEMINTLNLIGFEVDDIFLEESTTNKFITNKRLLIKIPANREDLLSETFLLKEFSLLFLFEVYETWTYLKNNYDFLLKKEYNQTKLIPRNSFVSPFSNFVAYRIDFTLNSDKESPLWLKTKLMNQGILSKNVLLDILNLVFAEFGTNFGLSISELAQNDLHPLTLELVKNQQIFDPSLENTMNLSSGSIILRNEAKEVINIFSSGNMFIDLEKIEKKVTEFSKQKNNNSEINETFSLTFLFNDCFENKNLEINSNLKRFLPFLRKSFSQNIHISFQRILTLLELTADAKISKIYSSDSHLSFSNDHKLLSLEKILFKKLLNVDSYESKVFQQAGLKLVGETNETLYFDIPTYRRDLEREIDLIEEYSRFIGYKNFIEIIPTKIKILENKQFRRNEFITSFFLNYGFNEIFTNSIQESKNQKNQLQISNPLNQELASLRTNLFKGLVEAFELNLKLGSSNLNFFEIGRVFKKVQNKIIEQDKLTGIFQFKLLRDTTQLSYNWVIVKGFIEVFLSNFGYLDVTFEPYKKTNIYFHPTRTVLIKSGTKILGHFGELHPKIGDLQSSKFPIYVFDFNLIHFKDYKMKNKFRTVKDSSKYPSVMKDLSFSIPKKESFSKLKNYIQTSTKMLKNVEFFDLYLEKETIENKVNIGVRLEFQSLTTTLTSDFIEKEINELKENISKLFQVQFKI